jgi:hypothetical protein
MRLNPMGGRYNDGDGLGAGAGEGAGASGAGPHASVATVEQQAGLRLEDLATRRAAAGPYSVPHGAESAHKDKDRQGQGGLVAGEEDRGLVREQQGVVVSCPPTVEWQARPPEVGRRREAGRGGAEGLRQEKQRRIALLGLVSPRTDYDVLAPAPPHPAVHRVASPRAGAKGGGGGGVAGDESPYGLLGALLQDTPRRAVGRAGLDSAGESDEWLQAPTPRPDAGHSGDPRGRMALPGGASLGERRAGLSPVAEAQTEGQVVQCGCGEGGGFLQDAGRAQSTEAGGSSGCTRDMDWEAASDQAEQDSGMPADAGLLPDAGLSGRITCLHLGQNSAPK